MREGVVSIWSAKVAERDLMIFGMSVAKITADGKVERVDPRELVITGVRWVNEGGLKQCGNAIAAFREYKRLGGNEIL